MASRIRPNLQEGVSSQLENAALRTERVRFAVYVGVLILLVGLFVYILSIILNVLAIPVGIVIWTTIIVFCLKGPVNWLEGKGVRRGWGVFITFCGFVAVLAVLLFVSFSPMFGFGEQFADLLANLSGYLSTMQGWFSDLYSHYSYVLQDETVRNWLNDAMAAAGSWFSSLATQSAQGAVAIGTVVGNSVMVIGFSLVVAYWVLLELPAMGREIRRLFGPRFEEDLNIFYLTGTQVMGGYIKGTLIQCFMIGLACGIGFAILGIPSAAALGVIAGLLNIIPVIGAWLGGLLAAIVGIFVSPLVAIIAVAYTVVVQQVVYTFISPRIMGNSVNIHPALIIIALLIGSAVGMAMSGLVGSFVGALLSIPAVAALKSLFVYYFEKHTGRRIVAPDGVIFQGEVGEGPEASPLADATGEIRLPKTDDVGAHSRKS